MRATPCLQQSLWILVVILFACGQPLAADKEAVQFQGVVMSVDFKKNVCVVNEKDVQWFPYTGIYREKGIPCSIETLKVNGWVYIEGVTNHALKRIEAKKIYILSKRVDEKDKALYPFMKWASHPR